MADLDAIGRRKGARVPRDAESYEPRSDAMRRLRAILDRIDSGVDGNARVKFSITVAWYVPGSDGPASITWSNKGRRT